MSTTAPSRTRIALMLLFAASCVGLLLFLWLSFGGSVPLKAQGYRLTVEFDQAVQLGTQADVEVSGVTIGKVVKVSLDRRHGLTRAVLQIDPGYAPRPADTRAILRQKTLLGETYVALTFGDQHGRKLADGATIPHGQVDQTVQLDEILNTFDPQTRRAFEDWMRDDGTAFTDRGEDFNAALADLEPFATNVAAVLAVLQRDGSATRTLLADGGQVLSAVAASPNALQGAIRNSNTVFATTAARDRELAAAIRAFPAFLQDARSTITTVRSFAGEAQPLIDELKPAAAQLSPALIQTAKLAPQLKALMVAVGPLADASARGVPALVSFLDTKSPSPAGASKALLAELTPYLGNVVPVIDYVNVFRRELAGFFGNAAATTNATSQSIDNPNNFLHYLRISAPLGPESLAAYAERILSNRSNAYMTPGSDTETTTGYMTLKNKALDNALQTFGGYLCTTNAVPTISSALQSSLPSSLYQILTSVYYGGSYPNVPHPACNQQRSLGAATGVSSAFYPRLQPLP